MLKKIGTFITSLSVALAPASSLLTSTFSRATIGALVGTSAVMLPSAAHAQSGKRICAIKYGTGGNSTQVYIAMEVSKYDLITCGASWVALQGIAGSWSLANLVSAALNAGAGKSYYYNVTCEKFSSDAGFRGDICNSMTDYHIYSVFRGGLSKKT